MNSRPFFIIFSPGLRYRMAKPRKVPVFYYSMMLDCMQPDAANRPTFAKLLDTLSGLASSTRLKEAGVSLIDGTGATLGPYQFTGPPYQGLERHEVRETASKTIKAWHNLAEANTKQRSREMARSMKENKKKGKKGTSKGLAVRVLGPS